MAKILHTGETNRKTSILCHLIEISFLNPIHTLMEMHTRRALDNYCEKKNPTLCVWKNTTGSISSIG